MPTIDEIINFLNKIYLKHRFYTPTASAEMVLEDFKRNGYSFITHHDSIFQKCTYFSSDLRLIERDEALEIEEEWEKKRVENGED